MPKNVRSNGSRGVNFLIIFVVVVRRPLVGSWRPNDLLSPYVSVEQPFFRSLARISNDFNGAKAPYQNT